MLPKIDSQELQHVKTNGEYVIARIPSSLINHYWPEIDTALSVDESLWNLAHTKESLQTQLEAGVLQCWLVQHNGEIKMLFFVLREDYPTMSALRIVWAQGREVAKYISFGLTGVEEYAKLAQCKFVGIDAHRIGWSKLLAPLNYNPMQTTFFKEIRIESIH